MKISFIAIVPVLLVVFISGCTTQTGDNGGEVTSFEECEAAGYDVMESYPRQCRTPDGQTFVENIDDPLIGGERDEYGCLGAAGYAWSDIVDACIRDWELGENETEAASIAIDYVGSEYATTVVEVLTVRCPGCYAVKLEQGEERNPVTVTINNWIVESDDAGRHICTELEKAAEICTLEYHPVCGWDSSGNSETYGNGCSACSAGVGYWESGECEP
jgi:hypothetical protein